MANKVKIPRNTPKQVVKEVPEEQVLVPVDESPVVTVKRVLKSKTIWINLLSLLALFVQRRWGFIIPEDLQIELLSIINIGLRLITKEKLVWKVDTKS